MKPLPHLYQEPTPRATNMAETFTEWEAKALAYEQYDYSHGGDHHERALFDMRGQLVFLETSLPWNFLKNPTVRTIAADFTIRQDSETAKLAEQHGATWEPGYYMDDDYGWPVFYGDKGLEQCFNFLKERTALQAKGIAV